MDTMTAQELDQLVDLLRKLKKHLKAGGAPLSLISNISDMRKATTFARKIGLR